MINGEYLYVGKTSETIECRIRRHYMKPVSKSMEFFLSNTDPRKVEIQLIKDNLTEEEAADLEMKYIDKYRKKHANVVLNDKYIDNVRMWNTIGYQLNRVLEQTPIYRYVNFGDLKSKKPKIYLPKNYRLKCPKCQNWKHFEEYDKDDSRANGRRSWCQLCTKTQRTKQQQVIYDENKRLYPNGSSDYPKLYITCRRCKQNKKNIEYYHNYKTKKFIDSACKKCRINKVSIHPRIHDDTLVKCTHCQEVKKAKEFTTNHEMKKGIKSYCKKCANERLKVWLNKKKNEKAMQEKYI